MNSPNNYKAETGQLKLPWLNKDSATEENFPALECKQYRNTSPYD